MIISHRKISERSVEGKFMTGIMWWIFEKKYEGSVAVKNVTVKNWRVFENSAIFLTVNNFNGHNKYRRVNF